MVIHGRAWSNVLWCHAIPRVLSLCHGPHVSDIFCVHLWPTLTLLQWFLWFCLISLSRQCWPAKLNPASVQLPAFSSLHPTLKSGRWEETPLGHTNQYTYNSLPDLSSPTSSVGHTSSWELLPVPSLIQPNHGLQLAISPLCEYMVYTPQFPSFPRASTPVWFLPHPVPASLFTTPSVTPSHWA